MRNKLRNNYDLIVIVMMSIGCLYWILAIEEVGVPFQQNIAAMCRGIFGVSSLLVPVFCVVLTFCFLAAVGGIEKRSRKQRWKPFQRVLVLSSIFMMSVSSFFYILVNQMELHNLHWAFEKGKTSFYGGIIGYLGAKLSCFVCHPHIGMVLYGVLSIICFKKLLGKKMYAKITKEEYKAFGKSFCKNPFGAVYDALKLEE